MQNEEETEKESEQIQDKQDIEEWDKLLDDLMDVDQYYKYAETSFTASAILSEHLETISTENVTTKIELALVVFSFINKHCQGSLIPLKHLLQVLQLTLPSSNSFPKTPMEFSQVNHSLL